MTEQRWDPRTYAKHARFVSDLGAGVVDLLAPARGERILDLGCGDGALTEKLVAAGAQVVASTPARSRWRPRAPVGSTLGWPARRRCLSRPSSTPCFSNAALHWMRDADAVLVSVRRALRPGGRFVAEMGGAGNVAAIRAALAEALGPPRHRWPRLRPAVPADGGGVSGAARGARASRCATIALFARPTPLPGDLSAWLETFAQPSLRAVSDGDGPG